MNKKNHPYGIDELEEAMAAGGNIFREVAEDDIEESDPKHKLVKKTRNKLKKKKEAK